jgi:hypothetical protein
MMELEITYGGGIIVFFNAEGAEVNAEVRRGFERKMSAEII